MSEYRILIREVEGCYETLNETNGEVAFADTLTEIARYAIGNGLGMEFGNWSDDVRD